MCAYKYIYLPAHCLKVVVYSCVQESAAGVIVSWCSPCVGKTLVVLITCRLLITWLCNGPSTVAASHSFDAMSLSSHGWSLASVTNFFFRVSAAWIINQWNLSNPRCMGLVTWLGAVLLHSLTSSRGLNCANFRYVSGNTMRRRWWVFVLLAIWKKKKTIGRTMFYWLFDSHSDSLQQLHTRSKSCNVPRRLCRCRAQSSSHILDHLTARKLSSNIDEVLWTHTVISSIFFFVFVLRLRYNEHFRTSQLILPSYNRSHRL